MNSQKPNWKKFFGRKIKANNLSGYFHEILFEFIKYYGPGKNILLVLEPLICKKVFKEYFGYMDIDIDNISYEGERGEEYKFDLNVIVKHEKKISKQYDIVFCQAVLEHICRPSILIENLVDFTNDGKYIILMSVNPRKKYHGYPLDCVRFFADFYKDLTNYLSIELMEFEEDEKGCQFIVYRKKE